MTPKEEVVSAVYQHFDNKIEEMNRRDDAICWGYWWNDYGEEVEDSGHGACHAYLDHDTCRDSDVVGSVIYPPTQGITVEQAQEFYEFLLDADISPYASLIRWLGDDLVVVRNQWEQIVGIVTCRNFNNMTRINFFKAFRDPCEHPYCTKTWLRYKEHNPTVAFGLSHMFHENADAMRVDHSVIDTGYVQDCFNIAPLVNPTGNHWDFEYGVGDSYYGETKYMWGGGKFNWRKDIPQKGKKKRTPAQKSFFYNKYFDKDPVPGSYTPEELVYFLRNVKEITGYAA